MFTALTQFQTELLFTALILMAILVSCLLIVISKLHKRVTAIPHLTLSEDILKSLNEHKNDLVSHAQSINAIKNNIQAIQEKQTLSYRSYVHRYNPFRDSGVGGNQSFSIALADEHGDGLLITSLYSREMNRVSSKPLSNWTNDEYSISPEEQHTINQLRK